MGTLTSSKDLVNVMHVTMADEDDVDTELERTDDESHVDAELAGSMSSVQPTITLRMLSLRGRLTTLTPSSVKRQQRPLGPAEWRSDPFFRFLARHGTFKLYSNSFYF